MKVCDKTCIFCFFPIINNYLCMAKRSLLSRCPSYFPNSKSYIIVFCGKASLTAFLTMKKNHVDSFVEAWFKTAQRLNN